MFRKQNGITLVALVITIVVLLILAGVTISSLTGNDSLLSGARQARNAYADDEKNTQTFLNDAMDFITNELPKPKSPNN